MFESILTICITGLVAGFIFAMPIAGPVSILITSNALKGRLGYCFRVSLGASIADFIFVFVAVFGVTKLYSFYAPIVPYMFAAGFFFFIFLGNKIFRTKIDIEHLEDNAHLSDRFSKKQKGGFYTGLMTSLLNPTLFLGSLTSSFFVITLIASLGFHTGGLAKKLDQNVKEVTKMEGVFIERPNTSSFEKLDEIALPKRQSNEAEPTNFPPEFHLVISLCYAIFLAAGSVLWFYLLAFMIAKFRFRINIRVIAGIIKGLGIILVVIGFYFGYKAVTLIF